MARTLTQDTPSKTESSSEQPALLVRKSAILVGTVYSISVAAMLVAAPEMMTFIPMWTLWLIVMSGVAAAYISGHVVERRSSRHQSGRMRRWITTNQPR